jgi:hypothetical protein
VAVQTDVTEPEAVSLTVELDEHVRVILVIYHPCHYMLMGQTGNSLGDIKVLGFQTVEGILYGIDTWFATTVTMTMSAMRMTGIATTVIDILVRYGVLTVGILVAENEFD